MSTPADDGSRNVIPRWRDSRQTLVLGEMAPVSESTEIAPVVVGSDLEALRVLRKEYEAHGTEPFAGDLLSTAIVLGRGDLVADVADKIVGRADSSPTLWRLARRVLGMSEIDATPRIAMSDGEVKADELVRRIVRIKRRLRDGPRNAFDWIDLGLLYESLGQRDHAERAVRTGLALAPSNRFVLRCASRFLIHRNEFQEAHRLLVRAPALKHDPWLLAAEIAAANVMGRTSANVKSARKWIESGKLLPFHVSELASAIGTLELAAGSMKFAKRMFRASLEQPTENAVAQASWADRHFGGGFLWQTPDAEILSSPEANAVSLLQTEKWTESLEYTKQWLADQPFSAAPVINASFLYSSVMADPASAVAVCRFGLMANPDDLAIRNNMAFAYCQLGDPDSAERTVKHLPYAELNDHQSALISATRGLIAFRRNLVQAGRLGYQEAIDYFERHGEAAHALRARMYLAVEEIRAGNESARSTAHEVIKEVLSSGDAATKVVAKRINEQLGSPLSQE